jgi:cell division protein FtsN
MAMVRGLALAGAVAFVLAAQPALADVKAGVDAWSRGDYALAVREWQGPAEAGDPDALFNLAQAYRLGRGVPVDEARAETYYARAAAKGHVQAADTYGLLLFQSGRRELALPYVEDAARRGDPRSQYLLGIAYFNGDLVSKDWVKAYALLTLANSTGLPQAAPALAQMDQSVPLAQRQQAAGLAEQMRTAADAARGRELAAAELAAGPSEVVTSSAPPVPTPSSRIPRPIPQVAVSPSIAAARAAVAEASRVTGTASPAEAGADFARPNAAPPPPPVAVARPEPTPAPAPAARTPPPPPVSARTSGRWRIQLGAFSVAGNADKLWARLAARPELAGRTKLTIPAGRVTKLQAGGFATQAQAESACRALKSAGQDCLVTTH